MAKQKKAKASNTEANSTALATSMKIGFCSCKSEYQDSKYGRGKRAMNKCNEKVGFRCTVCGSTK